MHRLSGTSGCRRCCDHCPKSKDDDVEALWAMIPEAHDSDPAFAEWLEKELAEIDKCQER